MVNWFISVREQFIFISFFFFFFFFWGAHTFLVRFARIPPALKTSLSGWGGGGGGAVAGRLAPLFFHRARINSILVSVYIGVHEILQVIPAKTIDERKKNGIYFNFFPEFARSLPEFLYRQKNWGAQCPPPPRLIRLCDYMKLSGFLRLSPQH